MSDDRNADQLVAEIWRLRRERRVGDARTMAVNALAKYREGRDTAGLARVICAVAQIDRDDGERAKAVALYGEAAGLFRKLGDDPGLAYALRHEGDIHRELAQLPQAGACLDEALAIYRRLDSTPLELANILRVCAILKEDLGDKAAARQLWSETLDKYWACDEQLRKMTGGNAGVAEATRRLAALA
jgi:tetratricopeptide (TPR) repeat protein